MVAVREGSKSTIYIFFNNCIVATFNFFHDLSIVANNSFCPLPPSKFRM